MSEGKRLQIPGQIVIDAEYRESVSATAHIVQLRQAGPGGVAALKVVIIGGKTKTQDLAGLIAGQMAAGLIEPGSSQQRPHKIDNSDATLNSIADVAAKLADKTLRACQELEAKNNPAPPQDGPEPPY